MWEETDIEEAIAAHPEAVEAAISALKLEPEVQPVELAAFKATAKKFNMAFEAFLVSWLKSQQLLESFVQALASRGVTIGVEPPALDDTHIDPDALARFAGAAKAFRCRIRKGDQVAGSGVLVGPNTVLTAWHVVAAAAPGKPQEPAPDIRVILSDNKTVAAWPPSAWESYCGDREYKNQFPASDAEVKDRHDVALLRLARPVGALLGTASLAETPASFVRDGPVLLVHYPEGEDHGLGNGVLRKARRLSARWSHTIRTDGGSSGGACFNAKLHLLGVHQGKDLQGRGRLVPASLFYDHLREVVANDQAPPRMWSLDGTPDGEFVIGRQAFFEAFAAVQRNPRVRGIRIKRANAAGDLSGLPFSYRILEQLVARRTDLRVIRLSFEKLVEDVADEIARRASDAGIPVAPIRAKDGVAEGQTAPEAIGADRGRRVTALLDASAAELGIQAWIFIDHPAVAFGDVPRPALEAFVDTALQLEHIRLAIAGFEAVALPGQDFYGQPDPLEQGARGFINEVIAGFTRSDVRQFLNDAAAAAGKDAGSQHLDELVDEALDGLPNVNGTYEPWVGAEVAARLRGRIAQWFAQ